MYQECLSDVFDADSMLEAKVAASNSNFNRKKAVCLVLNSRIDVTMEVISDKSVEPVNSLEKTVWRTPKAVHLTFYGENLNEIQRLSKTTLDFDQLDLVLVIEPQHAISRMNIVAPISDSAILTLSDSAYDILSRRQR